ncbi:lipopolysaccharide biosynthesis protein [Salinivibrio sp. YCSC6]|uniref:lipopolysaccharide biosynthesis protein n=1 Tax=Salinivibrio sp. YCSC6 TaxID=2003370 RepID=UPI000BBBF177|nr:oligosaccharide flippase family protein [Salinivibrio sp. YCSC6]PCE67632.1 polysaccharide biosynthesis protein [Salinivibrio sp. YCSC6]QCF35468.1 lipopolysaccharide biosynthesis protein [Salinivibrio sp. YCSC6]
MLKKIQEIAKSKFIRNVVIVATGTAGAQAISMAFSPVITRLYGPEAFGLLGTFMAILAVVTPIAALSYPIAIVLPKSDQDAVGIAKLSAFLSFTMAVLLTVILLLFRHTISDLLNLKDIAHFLLLIPAAMLFSAFYQILQQWLIRKKQFKVTAKAAIIQSISLNIAKVGIGCFHPVALVLIVLATVANLLHAFLLWLGIRKQPNSLPSKTYKEKSSHIKGIALKYQDFPLFRAPQVAINALSQSLPVLMLASFFGPASAGFYTLGKTVMGIPTTLIGKSVGDVFYPRLTEASHNQESLFRLILKATLALAAVGFFPYAAVVAFGPWLFSFIFGPEWVIAGEYARWMAVWLYFGFLNRPSVAAIATLSMQDAFLVYEIISILLRCAALYTGFVLFSDEVLAVLLFSSVGVVLNFSLVLYTLIKSRKINFE